MTTMLLIIDSLRMDERRASIKLELLLYDITAVVLCNLGLKPSQRKVLFTCFKRNDKQELKVAQLAGSVAEMSAYRHDEVS